MEKASNDVSILGISLFLVASETRVESTRVFIFSSYSSLHRLHISISQKKTYSNLRFIFIPYFFSAKKPPTWLESHQTILQLFIISLSLSSSRSLSLSMNPFCFLLILILLLFYSLRLICSVSLSVLPLFYTFFPMRILFDAIFSLDIIILLFQFAITNQFGSEESGKECQFQSRRHEDTFLSFDIANKNGQP